MQIQLNFISGPGLCRRCDDDDDDAGENDENESETEAEAEPQTHGGRPHCFPATEISITLAVIQ